MFEILEKFLSRNHGSGITESSHPATNKYGSAGIICKFNAQTLISQFPTGRNHLTCQRTECPVYRRLKYYARIYNQALTYILFFYSLSSAKECSAPVLIDIQLIGLGSIGTSSLDSSISVLSQRNCKLLFHPSAVTGAAVVGTERVQTAIECGVLYDATAYTFDLIIIGILEMHAGH